MSDHEGSGIIHRLPDHLANQIAAGEVVQRPESVVKELVENAIDADATSITVVIGGAGKTVIQVVDDGCGMSAPDALQAFERHATSKIGSYQDLTRIRTLGFRGEALPSIASIAQVELRTRRAEDEMAVLVRFEGGTLIEQTRTQGASGTSITVRNLFYNTPARRQFLKSDATELRHITETMERFVLSYPHLRIQLVSDGETLIQADPGTVRDRVATLFGRSLASSLIDVGEETEILTVGGLIGKPDFSRKTRGDQYLFVNGRSVVSRYLNHAVVQSYENLVDRGEFPFYVLFLNVDPEQVDVNVHPAKLEVKFSNERNIYTILGAVIRKHLYQTDLSPHMTFHSDMGGDTRMRFEPASHSEARQRDALQTVPAWAPTPKREAGVGSTAYDVLFGTPVEHGGEASTRDREEPTHTLFPSVSAPATPHHALWQLHNKYIIAPIKGGMMIIDQHVAHERILYERAQAALEHAAPFSQQLLFPHPLRLDAKDAALLEELRPDLERMGFVLSIGQGGTISVDAVPQDVRVGMEERILEEMLDQYHEYQQWGSRDSRDVVAASFACRAAIKAGDPLSVPEMQSLIDQLFATSNPFICPHGRPVIVKLTLEELDRRFGRS